jgi:hypothetical protein
MRRRVAAAGGPGVWMAWVFKLEDCMGSRGVLGSIERACLQGHKSVFTHI